MKVLTVDNLVKRYEKFQLKEVSFAVEEGAIVGLVGRNGAGKTTTLKSMLGLIHSDSGEITFFGKSFSEYELEIKEQIGFVSGGIHFYPKKKLKVLTDVTRMFYKDWDEKMYQKYLKLFSLDEDKKADELSEGMKVKYLLAIALSHHAKFLIFDEPTSGLDPISRDELLNVFLDVVEKEKVTILYSTHIISDLEKCADRVIYIQEGRIKFEASIKDLKNKYKLVSGSEKRISKCKKDQMIGLRIHDKEFKCIMPAADVPEPDSELLVAEPTLEDIIIYLERGIK